MASASAFASKFLPLIPTLTSHKDRMGFGSLSHVSHFLSQVALGSCVFQQQRSRVGHLVTPVPSITWMLETTESFAHP